MLGMCLKISKVFLATAFVKLYHCSVTQSIKGIMHLGCFSANQELMNKTKNERSHYGKNKHVSCEVTYVYPYKTQWP